MSHVGSIDSDPLILSCQQSLLVWPVPRTGEAIVHEAVG